MVTMPPALHITAMGNSRLFRGHPLVSHIAHTMGNSSAQVPVLLRKADIAAVIAITAMQTLSRLPPVFSNTNHAIRPARPV